jgi:hypothetical protein
LRDRIAEAVTGRPTAPLVVRRADRLTPLCCSCWAHQPASVRSRQRGAFAPDGRCIALLEDREGSARLTVVFAPAAT